MPKQYLSRVNDHYQQWYHISNKTTLLEFIFIFRYKRAYQFVPNYKRICSPNRTNLAFNKTRKIN